MLPSTIIAAPRSGLPEAEWRAATARLPWLDDGTLKQRADVSTVAVRKPSRLRESKGQPGATRLVHDPTGISASSRISSQLMALTTFPDWLSRNNPWRHEQVDVI
jgi:hypothetical protein